jgi:ATP/ADP translocase
VIVVIAKQYAEMPPRALSAPSLLIELMSRTSWKSLSKIVRYTVFDQRWRENP